MQTRRSIITDDDSLIDPPYVEKPGPSKRPPRKRSRTSGVRTSKTAGKLPQRSPTQSNKVPRSGSGKGKEAKGPDTEQLDMLSWYRCENHLLISLLQCSMALGFDTLIHLPPSDTRSLQGQNWNDIASIIEKYFKGDRDRANVIDNVKVLRSLGADTIKSVLEDETETLLEKTKRLRASYYLENGDGASAQE
ncbi:hypothetical protein ONS96_005278 [Cadophora gregata f. sp. sojae]|nr:hypothetical protein ONS96_005278 [Cadophora gregata f. sp. sojae]